MLDFDEINNLVLTKYDNAETQTEFVEEITDLFIDIYLMGIMAVTDMLDYQLDMGKSLDKALDTIYQPIDGKTFEDRIREYAEVGAISEIQKVVANESHRIYNASSFDTAQTISTDSGKNISKVWITMEDDRVRDSHDYLLGTIVPLNEKFYTYNGHSSYYPGQFGVADEDINCRCEVAYIYD